VFLSGNVINRFWPAVKTYVSGKYISQRRNKLFFDPRLGTLVRWLLDILLLVTKHLDRS